MHDCGHSCTFRCYVSLGLSRLYIIQEKVGIKKKKLRPTPLLWIVHRLAKYFRLAQLSHQFKKPRIKEGEEKIKNKKWVGHKVTEVTEPSNFGMLLHL